MGCFRPALRVVRAYHWLEGTGPQIWLELTQLTDSPVHGRRLGQLSRVLTECYCMAKRLDAPSVGHCIQNALTAIAIRS
eukprot:667881-Amphidinium_carterae.1